MRNEELVGRAPIRAIVSCIVETTKGGGTRGMDEAAKVRKQAQSSGCVDLSKLRFNERDLFRPTLYHLANRSENLFPRGGGGGGGDID